MTERFLILGGARFHGLQLAELLAGAGKEVFVLNRGNYKPFYDHGIRLLKANRNDPGQMRSSLKGLNFDAVIDNNAYTPAQIEAVLDLLQGRCGHYIFTSTAAVYMALSSDRKLREDETQGVTDNAYSPMVRGYALNKLAAEETLRHKAQGLDYTILRLPNIFGAGDFLGKLSFFYYRIKDSGKVLLEKEVDRFSLVFVKDAVRVMAAVIGNKECFGMTINVADPVAYTYEQFFSTVFGGFFFPNRMILLPAKDAWDAGYFLPLAWGPMIDTSLLQDVLDCIDFTPLSAWGKDSLEWELGNFGDRMKDPDFARRREYELTLIERFI